jgi:hypothetical protein
MSEPLELLDVDAPDVEDFVVCWMQPVMRCATERDTNDVLPFCVVTRIAGADDECVGVDDPTVQLDFFAAGAAAASVAAKTGHRRMNYLSQHLPAVTMSDGSTVGADYVETVLKPFRMAYADDRIVRYTGRYIIGLHYVAVV